MAAYSKQHFIPQFLLKQWAGEDDQKLTHFFRFRGELQAKRKSPAVVARENNLLNFRYRQDKPSHKMESVFMGPEIDNPAGPVLFQMLCHGVSDLTDAQVSVWARLVASLILRNPIAVKTVLRGNELADYFRSTLNGFQSDYDAIRGPNDPKSPLAYLDHAMPGYANDAGIAAIPEAIESLARRIAEKEWAVISINLCRFDFLLGDKAVMVTKEEGTDVDIVFLPISPRHIFVAGRDGKAWKKLLRLSPDKLTRLVNEDMVLHAEKDVFSSGPHHRRFVDRRLKNQLE